MSTLSPSPSPLPAPTAPVAAGELDPPRRRGGRRLGAGTTSPVATAFMVAFFIYFLIPLVWLLISATKSNADLFTSFGFWFSGFNLTGNLHDLFTAQDGVFGRWMVNSAVYAVVSAGGAALLATAAGYGFALYEFAGKKLLFGLILGAIAVPTTALAIPTYLLFSKMGIVNTPWAVILPSLISPFGIYLMRIYAADAVPYSLLESARLDGSSEVRTFFAISFRMMVPGFITVLLLTLVATWNNYFLPLVMLNDPSLFPTTVGLARWNSAANAGGGSQALFSIVVAGALVSIIPLVAAFLALQRFWQSGLNAGSVK